MQCNFIAARAVLLDFHFLSMLTLISCTDVILLTALSTLECDIFSWHYNTS